MKRILTVSVLALGLAGCNATVYDGGYYRSRPVVDIYTPSPVYYPPRPAYNPYVYNVPVIPRHRPHCYFVDRRTPYGIRSERVCR